MTCSRAEKEPPLTYLKQEFHVHKYTAGDDSANDIKVQRLVVVKLAGRHHTMNKIRIMEEDLPEVLINGSCENYF